MTAKAMKWTWAIGVPGAILTALTLIYGGLSAVFETHTAHADDLAVWGALSRAEAAERQREDIALNLRITTGYDALRATTDEMQRDVSQLVCVVVKKGRPFGKQCTLPNGQTVDAP